MIGPSTGCWACLRATAHGLSIPGDADQERQAGRSVQGTPTASGGCQWRERRPAEPGEASAEANALGREPTPRHTDRVRHPSRARPDHPTSGTRASWGPECELPRRGSWASAQVGKLDPMVTSFAEAVEALYRAPLDAFVAERKRLAAELKANADKPGAARLIKLARPPISTWVVNQLWWQARDVFDELFASAARLRVGDLRATPAHREAIAALRTRATAILAAAGHAATDATLRRVTTNLSALAAAGGFEPDFAGALAMDREAPGFEAAGLGLSTGLPSVQPEQRERGRVELDLALTTPSAVTSSVSHPVPANQNQLARAEPRSGQLADPEPESDVEPQRAIRGEGLGAKEAQGQREEEAERQREEEAERQRAEEAERLRAEEAERLRAEEAEQLRVAEAERQRAAERARLQAEADRQRQEARRRAERQQVQEEVGSLQGERDSRQRERERLRQALALTERELERVHSRLAALEARLSELDE
jgi:hypothetical protein